MQLLIGTIQLRPYVFIFLLIYVVGCTLHLGLKRAVLFGIVGYVIAWGSEFSSIHTGFPYGLYYYIEITRGQELWTLGVPFMDSISYVFLAYASYSLALLIASPVFRTKWAVYVLETRQIRNSLIITLLGTILFVYLDIIIDPVALRGERWFLGRIYGYPEQGIYFGVPLSNFAGWFIVGFCMIAALQRIDSFLSKMGAKDYYGYQYPWRYLIGPGLYTGVLVFNLVMTFLVHESTLGWVGIFIVILPAFMTYTVIRLKLSQDLKSSWRAHLNDFPAAATWNTAAEISSPARETVI